MQVTKLFVCAIALLLFGCQENSLTHSENPSDLEIGFRGAEKLLVCHNTESGSNPWELIEVAEIAYVKAHQEHGDALPGEPVPGMEGYKFGCHCEIEEVIESKLMLDNKLWTTQNLDIVPTGFEDQAWWFDDDPANSAFGRLYTWDAAFAACASLDGGWRLPTKADWDGLITKYDNTWTPDGNPLSTDAYTALLSDGGPSPSGFDAILGGYLDPRSNPSLFTYLGAVSYYWSQTEEEGPEYAWHYQFNSFTNGLRRDWEDKNFGFSCRCVQGN